MHMSQHSMEFDHSQIYWSFLRKGENKQKKDCWYKAKIVRNILYFYQIFRKEILFVLKFDQHTSDNANIRWNNIK